VAARLLALKPAAEKHFRLRLSGSRPPQFLVYRPGDFFRRHRDSSADPGAGEAATGRKVSAVAFLNGAEGEDGYGGGALVFYGLLDDPRGEQVGFPLTPEAGLLVAFRSDVIHEVTPVTHGERCTVVSWFF
jgi:SM-20-related protein